ncbi:MAG: hypothetical protein QXQ79_01255 [Candidatus Nanoarchaeia archaeon]
MGKILKIAGLIFLGVFLFSIYESYLVFKDLQDLRENFENSKNLFILKLDEKIVAGFELNFSTGAPEFLDNAKITAFNTNFPDHLKDYYKIFVFNDKIFYDLPARFSVGDLNLTKEEFINLLKSADPIEIYIDYSISKGFLENTSEAKILMRQKIYEELGSDASKIKGLLFASVLKDVFENPITLLLAIKERKIEIYPETPFFKIIKYLPKFLLNFLAKKFR